MDQIGHGSHCLGTVLGRDVNGTRIGVAQGVTDAIVSPFVPYCACTAAWAHVRAKVHCVALLISRRG